MTQPIEIGRLLRAGTTGFIAGCRVNQLSVPSFGALVRAPLGDGYQVYGLIHDIHIDDDGLVRQLVTSNNVSDDVMRDNRENRIVPGKCPCWRWDMSRMARSIICCRRVRR